MSAQTSHQQLLGKSGEAAAATYLLRKGYRLLTRNFRTRYGEIDLIVRDGATLVFVEVKTRTSTTFGLPEEAVTPHKLQEIQTVAAYYCAKHHFLNDLQRIDVVAIRMTRDGKIESIEHIIDVTA